MKKYLLFLLLLCLQACSREPKIEGSHFVTVSSRTLSNTLFYSGTIQPLRTLVIPSPAEGVVVDMPFQYGEAIKSGDLLFTLSSAKFLADYKAALMAYVKAKNDFNNSQTELSEAEFLHKNELISEDQFKMKKSNYYGVRLALLQAKDTLDNLLKQSDIKDIDLDNLTIANLDKITQAMHLQMHSENLRIITPAAGVVLSANKNDDDSKKVTKGDAVKQGDVLAIIGDMTGISVRIKVNEMTVNQLKVGQKVKVTGIAFPEHVLMGEIKRVDRQGEASSGGLPTFSAEIVVPKLTEKEQKEIHVGMSAKVQIDIEDQAQIIVPITAIIEKHGNPFLKVFSEGELKEVAVKTGKTTIDSVAILNGVKTGDRIVVPN